MLPLRTHIYDTPFFCHGKSDGNSRSFVFILCGHLLVRGNEDKHLYKDDLFYLEEGKTFELVPSEDSAFAVIEIQNLYLSSLANYYPVTILPDNSKVASNFKKSRSAHALFDCYFRQEGIQNDKLFQVIQRFSEDLIPCLSADLSASDASVLITRLMYILNRQYQDNLSLKTVAEELHVIPQYVSSLCRQKLGLGFHHILTERRLALSGMLLQCTNLNITQVCAISGFPNSKSFYQAFSNYYHVTPKTFRNVNSTSKLDPVICDNTRYLSDRELYWKYSSSDSYQSRLITNEKYIKASIENIQTFSFAPANVLYIGDSHNLLSTTCIAKLQELTASGKFHFVRLNKLFSENNNHPTKDYSEIVHIINNLNSINLYPMIACLIQPFKHTDECLIRFIQYIVQNYRIDEISNWKIELIPMKAKLGNPTAFSDLKNQIIKSFRYIQSMIPEIQIGLNIFSTSVDEEIGLRLCRELLKNGIIPDFQIANLYPLGLLSPQLWNQDDNAFEGRGRKRLSENPSYNYLHLKHFIEITDTLYLGQRKKRNWIVNTTLDLDGDNLLNGTLYATTFIMMNILRCQELADQFIMPILLEQYHFRYHKKFSLLSDIQSMFTADGLPTPLVFALRFLDLTGPFLISKSPYHLITIDEKGNITCLLINYKHPSRYFCAHPHIAKADDVEAIFYNYSPDEITVEIDLAEPSAYLYEEIFINNEHGSINDLLLKARPATSLNQSIINNLIGFTHPAHSIGYLDKTTSIKLSETLKPQEIRMIRLYPIQSNPGGQDY